MKTKKTQKGFTLVEILIVVALMALLAIAALMSSYKTQRYFAFLNTYKEVFQNLRLPRSYSATNKTVSFGVEEKTPAAYSAELKLVTSGTLPKYTITIFGDNPDGTINSYESDGTAPYDTVIGVPYELPADRFSIDVCTPGVAGISCDILKLQNLTISYIPNKIKILSTVEVKDSGGDQAIFTNTDQYIILRLRDKYSDIEKHMVIFTKSGIVESLDPTKYTITSPFSAPSTT